MKRTLSVSLALLVLAGASLVYAFEPTTAPCMSVRESKWHGLYVCSVSLEPNIIDCNGKQGILREAWIERNCKWGTFAYRAHALPGYRLCFALERNQVGLYSFGWRGSDYFGGVSTGSGAIAYHFMDNIDQADCTVTVQEDKSDRIMTIRLTPNLPSKMR